MKGEVRTVGLKAMREKKGLTQRKLAHDLGVSQNHTPAIEAGARGAGPRLPAAARQVLRLPISEELFQVVLVDPETKREQVLQPEQ